MSPRNLEFIDLFQSSGWNQAEAARRLVTTPATISRYLSGSIVPEPSKIELFKLILASEKPDALAAARIGGSAPAIVSDPVQQRLQELKEKDPDGYKLAASQIDLLHDRMASSPRPKPPPGTVTYRKKEPQKSKVDKIAEAGAKKAISEFSSAKAEAAKIALQIHEELERKKQTKP